MASIEIDSNTVIKLLARRGSDLERKNIVLAEGEFGYVVDLKRLYIGDGVTPGGIPTGVKFHNTTTNITNIGETVKINDLVYKSDTNEIYKLVSGDGSSLSDWELISSPKYVVVDNATIGLSASNGELFVKEISGKHISSEALGSGLSKVANKVVVSGDINVNTVTTLTANINRIKVNTESSLTIPNILTFTNNVSSIQYTFPLSGGADKYHLVTDGSGNLTWEPASVVVTSNTVRTDAVLPVGSIIFSAASSWTDPDGWLICDGRLLPGSSYPDLSAAIGTLYGGDANNFRLPNLTAGGMLFGAGTKGISPVGDPTRYPVGYPIRVAASQYITFYNDNYAGDTFNPLTITNPQDLIADPNYLTILNTASAFAGIWLIKHRKDSAVNTQISVLTSNGLSAFNLTTSTSTTSINLSGSYNLVIADGGVGTGNPAVVRAYNKARSPQMYTFSVPGSATLYTVSNNIYRIKVSITGPGGVGYTRYDIGGGNFRWRANGTHGGAGSSIIAYINVEPGEVYIPYVGRAGTAIRTPEITTDAAGVTAGWGDDSVFSLSASSGTITPLLSARGAYDPVTRGEITAYFADWSANGAARGGIRGGRPVTPTNAKVVSFTLLSGGDGGQFMTNGPSGPGAAGLYGSGPAPGGGGSGYARSDTAGQEVAAAGPGLIIVEEL